MVGPGLPWSERGRPQAAELCAMQRRRPLQRSRFGALRRAELSPSPLLCPAAGLLRGRECQLQQHGQNMPLDHASGALQLPSKPLFVAPRPIPVSRTTTHPHHPPPPPHTPRHTTYIHAHTPPPQAPFFRAASVGGHGVASAGGVLTIRRREPGLGDAVGCPSSQTVHTGHLGGAAATSQAAGSVDGRLWGQMPQSVALPEQLAAKPSTLMKLPCMAVACGAEEGSGSALCKERGKGGASQQGCALSRSSMWWAAWGPGGRARHDACVPLSAGWQSQARPRPLCYALFCPALPGRVVDPPGPRPTRPAPCPRPRPPPPPPSPPRTLLAWSQPLGRSLTCSISQ